MSLCRFLPVPSDRMGIVWSLLSIKDAMLLEYGPAGTTHYSMGFYSAVGVTWRQRLFTTHMNEDDVVMGDVSRLEQAVLEIDAEYQPAVLFVVASSISAVIGTDLKGVCRYLQEKTKAKLIALEQGGFRGDYSIGLKEVYKVLVTKLAKEETERVAGTVNILGASAYSYRIASDIWEISNLLAEGLDLKVGTVLCHETTIKAIENIGSAEINLVLREEALPAAKLLEKKFGQPYICGQPYGYTDTLHWLEEIGAALGRKVASSLVGRLQRKAGEAGAYNFYFRMSSGMRAQAFLLGEYQTVQGIGKFFGQLGLPVAGKICQHSLKNIAQAAEDVEYLPVEKDRIGRLRSLEKTLVLADETSLGLCGDSNTKLCVSVPLLNGALRATHLPIVGEKGADWLLEALELYLQNLR